MSWPGRLPPDHEGREFLPPDFEPRFPVYVPAPLPPVTLRSARRNIILFLLTAVSVFSTYGFTGRELPGGKLAFGVDWGAGLSFVGAVFAILLAHEFGHYFAARHYGVDASLPYFIPFPFLSLIGTLGAFIRIRSPIPHRRALFDIGVSGPLAGFVVCIPVLVLGVLDGRWVPVQNGGEGPGYLGEPLLFQWAVDLLKGPAPENMSLLIGPLGMAAWFGLFLTALNLIPVGQLDGGHAVHALLPGRSVWVSWAGILTCFVLLYFRPTWIVWALLLVAFGRRPHPPTVDERVSPGALRIALGLLTLGVFVLCFTPSPVLISWPEFLTAVRELLPFTSR